LLAWPKKEENALLKILYTVCLQQHKSVGICTPAFAKLQSYHCYPYDPVHFKILSQILRLTALACIGREQRWAKPGVGLESEYGVFCRIWSGVGVRFLLIYWSRSLVSNYKINMKNDARVKCDFDVTIGFLNFENFEIGV